MKAITLVSIILAALVAVSCTITPPETTPAVTEPAGGEGFAIYLTARDVPVSEMEALSYIEPAAEPVISLDDIVSYTWETHEIELTARGMDRLNSLQVPVNGRAFVVCLDRQPIYWGAFWVYYSSMSFDGITIMQPLSPEDRTIRIGQGYPSTGLFKGADPRSNSVILSSLEKAGKLVVRAATQQPAVTTRASVFQMPDDAPIVSLESSSVWSGRGSKLFIYEDGRVIYREDRNLRGVVAGGFPPTRTWRTGQVTPVVLDEVIRLLEGNEFAALEDDYSYSTRLPGGGVAGSGTMFVFSAAWGNVQKQVTTLSYMMPDGGTTYPDMPHPLDDIYARLRQISVETKEVATEEIK